MGCGWSNADSDADIVTLTDGAVINLAELATANLNVRATTNVAVASVAFALTGATTHNQTESVAPYALFGDCAGDFNAGAFAVGQHTLVVTPYSERWSRGHGDNRSLRSRSGKPVGLR